MPSAEFIQALIARGINPIWLLTGSGPMYIEPGQPSENNEVRAVLAEMAAQVQGSPEAIALLRRAVSSQALHTDRGLLALRLLVESCELLAGIPPSKAERQSEDQAEEERRRRA